MADENRVGDTPRTDEKPALVERGEHQPGKGEGDKPKAGHVGLVEVPEGAKPPKDGQIGDVRVAGHVGLVEDYGTPDDGLTPIERIEGKKLRADSEAAEDKKSEAKKPAPKKAAEPVNPSPVGDVKK